MNRSCSARLIAIVLGVVSFLSTLSADEFPPIHNSELNIAAQPMSAAEAAAGFEMPDGFHVSVFASEPEVRNPIAMTWDSRGRLWVAENYTYAERQLRFDLSMRDRVLIFEDTDNDGVADKRTVFCDNIQHLTSVEVGRGGVYLMCPPQLLFIPDRNHDDVPDGPAEVLLDGFDVPRDNYHNFANGLRWGPDGWLYGRCGGSCPGRVGPPGTAAELRTPLEGGIWRFDVPRKTFEVIAHGTTNPWGHDWNEWGDLFFINTVNGHLWHAIPGAHFDRPFTLDPNPHTYETIDMHADHWHFDTGQSWHQSRDGSANSFGGGHAHMGMMIYQGDNWPKDYRGNLFTFNFHGRRANQERLDREGSGYVARHGRDLLIASDPFFRGLDLGCGPDGTVTLIDWSDTGECHEATGVHRTSGRIYRVAYGDAPRADLPSNDLRSLSSLELVRLLHRPNNWYHRQATILLVERASATKVAAADDFQSALTELRTIAKGDDPQLAHRALMTLHAMRENEPEYIRGFLTHDNEHLRALAIRLLADRWPIDTIFAPPKLSPRRAQIVQAESEALSDTFVEMARSDSSALVRLALASVLQRMPLDRRAPVAQQLVTHSDDADDHNLPLMVYYGLMPIAEAHADPLADVATGCRWPVTQRLIARRLAEQIEQQSGPLESLLGFAARCDDAAVVHNILLGVAQGLKGWNRAPRPANWHDLVAAVSAMDPGKTQPNTIDSDEIGSLVRELSVLFGDGRALDEVRKMVLDNKTDIGLRRTALRTLVASGDAAVDGICLSLLRNAHLNDVAVKGVAASRDPQAAEQLVNSYYSFRAALRPLVIEVMVARPDFAAALLDAVEAEKIPASALSAFDIRQMLSLEEPQLNQRIAAVWGEVRESPQQKLDQIAVVKKQLDPQTLAAANLPAGRLLFNKQCASCHRLHGYGEQVGPDLTGSNRNNIDYLLENIVDPSAVVGKDYRMTVIETTDGRVLNGLVISSNDKTVTLQTQTERKTIDRENIDNLRLTEKSPMADGLLDTLTADQIRDLFAYLMQPAQVSLAE